MDEHPSSGRGRKHRALVERVLAQRPAPLRPRMLHYTDGQVPLDLGSTSGYRFEPESEERVAKRFATGFEHLVCGLFGGERGKQFTIAHVDERATRHIPDVIKHDRGRVTHLYEVKSLSPAKELQIKQGQWEGYQALQELYGAPVSVLVFRHEQQGLGTPTFPSARTHTKNGSRILSSLSELELYARVGQTVLSAVEIPLSVLAWYAGRPGASRVYAGNTTEPYVSFRSSLVDQLFAEPRALIAQQSSEDSNQLPSELFGDVRVEHRRSPTKQTLWGQPVRAFPITRITQPYEPGRLERIFERQQESASYDATFNPADL